MQRLPISNQRPVIVVGAGIAGLVAAFELSCHGVPTVVLESADRPGGKMRRAELDGLSFDAGPTVLTMRWVFEELFADAGLSFAEHVPTRPAQILARHYWRAADGSTQRLDLHADAARSAAAIARFSSPAEGQRFLDFCAEARKTYEALLHSFIRAQRPSMPGLVGRIGRRRPGDLLAIRPFETLWDALGRHFTDARLRQLFGRYATYCGSSPFDAPATLMLVAHVEQEGVWLVDQGMFRIAETLEQLARRRGVAFRYGAEATRIDSDAQGVRSVTLAGGETLQAGAVVANADAAALARGRLGPAGARAAHGADRLARSLSAITWLVDAPTEGLPLLRHNVFFSPDYRAEFDALFGRREVPADPTIYVCAQDRGAAEDEADAALAGPVAGTASGAASAARCERLLCLINAPADGDRPARGLAAPAGRDEADERLLRTLERFGLRVAPRAGALRRTEPAQFEQLYPGSGGALYGGASHGWRASFQRPGAQGAVPGLFLAGGSIHPGPGVPMAALSGRLAAQCVLAAR
jgi:1-hydroxycarotenoid 3,4-desaturase